MDALVANQSSLIFAFPHLKLLSQVFHGIKIEVTETGPDRGGNVTRQTLHGIFQFINILCPKDWDHTHWP